MLRKTLVVLIFHIWVEKVKGEGPQWRIYYLVGETTCYWVKRQAILILNIKNRTSCSSYYWQTLHLSQHHKTHKTSQVPQAHNEWRYQSPWQREHCWWQISAQPRWEHGQSRVLSMWQPDQSWAAGTPPMTLSPVQTASCPARTHWHFQQPQGQITNKLGKKKGNIFVTLFTYFSHQSHFLNKLKIDNLRTLPKVGCLRSHVKKSFL